MPSYAEDSKWSVSKIQPIAKLKIYNSVWPQAKIIPLDNDRRNQMKVILDIAGADKLLKWPDGGVAFLAQRFRRFEERDFDDFTLRYSRPSGRVTEVGKILRAFKRSGMIAAFYAYGHVNQDETDFLRFRVLRFVEFCLEWQSGRLPPDGRQTNKDRTTFLYWRFSKIPDHLFEFSSEPTQSSLIELPPPKSDQRKTLTVRDLLAEGLTVPQAVAAATASKELTKLLPGIRDIEDPQKIKLYRHRSLGTNAVCLCTGKIFDTEVYVLQYIRDAKKKGRLSTFNKSQFEEMWRKIDQ